jgi:signal recognition particle receptor subunit beta
MPKANPGSSVTARIVYWGAEGSGKTSSLYAIHSKLKADHRGDIKRVPTRLDPTVTFEEFPIQLGTLNGTPTELRVIAVPGAPGLAHTRKQLLDEIDGVVLVLDARAERLDDNIASVAELRESLRAYGRTLDEIPVVVQYNKRDLGDPFAIEELHRRLNLPGAAVFETVATDTTGVLQALTTISKRVVRVLRDRHIEPEPIAPAKRPTTPLAKITPQTFDAGSRPPRAPAAPIPRVDPTLRPQAETYDQRPAAPATQSRFAGHDAMEAAILAETDGAGEEAAETILEAQSAFDRPWPDVSIGGKASSGARIGADMKIVSVGAASRDGQLGVRVPLVLGNDEGETVTLNLRIQLEPLLDGDPT